MPDAQKHIDAIRAALTMGPDGLRPCPWCGNPDVATKVIEGSTDRWRCVTGCCTAGPEVRREAGPDAAVAAWNDRKINEALHAILAHIDQQAEEIERLRSAGSKLANCAYNLAHRSGHVLTDRICQTLDERRKEWDAAIAAKGDA